MLMQSNQRSVKVVAIMPPYGALSALSGETNTQLQTHSRTMARGYLSTDTRFANCFNPLWAH